MRYKHLSADVWVNTAPPPPPPALPSDRGCRRVRVEEAVTTENQHMALAAFDFASKRWDGADARHRHLQPSTAVGPRIPHLHTMPPENAPSRQPAQGPEEIVYVEAVQETLEVIYEVPGTSNILQPELLKQIALIEQGLSQLSAFR